MKKTVIVVAALFFSATFLAGAVIESIVARVGDRIVTRSQYENRLRGGIEEMRRTLAAGEVAAREAKFRSELLNELISELLLKDRADRIGIVVGPAEVQEAVGRLKKQYGMTSDAEFEESLRKSGMARAEMEARLRDTLITNKLFSRELKSRQDMTDRDLRTKYEREKDQYRLPERARVREIVLVAPEGADEAAMQRLAARAGEVAANARAGKPFVELVGIFSDAPSKEKGGDLGVVARGELLPELDKLIFADGAAIVGPVRTKAGFHVLSVEERLPSELPSFDAVKERLRQEAGEETFQRDYKAYIEQLRKEAFIEIHEDQLPKV